MGESESRSYDDRIGGTPSFSFVRQRCAIASGLGAIGEPVVEISQTHNYRSGVIVFQFFGRLAHLRGALPKMG